MEAALRSGVAMVQYRSKDTDDRKRLDEAAALSALCRSHGALFIVNDRIDLALAVDADGVHLGQEDLPISIARTLLGGDRLIGLSTHSLDEVTAAQGATCDYIGLGPAFPTAVKPDRQVIGPELIREATAINRLPLFAIGGINASNLEILIAAGCSRAAVIGAIMHADNPGNASLELLSTLSNKRAD